MSPTRTCLFCMKDVERLKRHLACHSKTHTEAEFLEIHNLCEEFLAANLPASGLFRQAIEEAGGLSTLQKKEEKRDEDGHVDSYLFSADRCRDQSVTDSQILNEAFHSYRKSEPKVYSVTKPGEPDKLAMLSDVMVQLSKPDLVNAKYAVNLGRGPGVRRPANMEMESTGSEMITTCNITPQGSFVDLHIDQGNHAITALGLGCVKIWALYPPTKRNLGLWREHRTSRHVFRELASKLEYGKVCIQPTDMAIYLGPGCLHATYTLKGGIVPGINYTTKECLEVIVSLLEIEIACFKQLGSQDIIPLLETVFLCLEQDSGKRGEALQVICESMKKAQLKKQLKNHPSFKKLKKEVEKKEKNDCPICQKRWRTHWT